jgi:hypothetical protein
MIGGHGCSVFGNAKLALHFFGIKNTYSEPDATGAEAFRSGC